MEARRSHLVIGGTALLFIAAIFAFVIWLAQVSFGGAGQRYQIYFKESVSGLQDGAPVRFNGVKVGSITSIRLNPRNPQEAIVTIEVRPDTPIRQGSTASQKRSGFVGQPYVEISGGSADQPMLEAQGGKLPVIPARPSGITELMQDVPAVMNRISTLSEHAADVLSQENQRKISQIIANMASVTDQLASHEAAMGQAIEQLAAAAQAMDRAAQKAPGMIDAGTEAAQNLKQMVAENRAPIREFTSQGLPEIRRLVSETRSAVENLSQTVQRLEENPSSVLFGRGGAGGATFTPEERR